MTQGRLTRRAFVGASIAAPAALALPISLSAALAQEGEVVTMVTDTNGLGDQNFNDLSNAGGTKAADELGFEWKVIESVDATAYVPNLTAAAEQGDLTVATGYFLGLAMEEVVPQFPDDKWLLIDTVVDAPTIRSVLFKEQQSSFLVGVASGKMTKTNKIGIVGGERIPPVIRYEVGFKAGVLAVNPDAEIAVAYVDSFSDPEKGKEFALAQYNDGNDIVFPMAGLSGLGCYEAVKELNKPGEQWILGGDVTQDHLAPGFELAVSRKGVDNAVYEGVKSFVEGTFETGTVTLGIAEGGVGFEDPNDRVPADVEALVKAYEALIVSGELVVPSTDEEFEAFVAPPVPEVGATPAG
jgi:basic membrane protein A and related proteins